MCPDAEMARRKGHIMKIQIRYDNQITTVDVPEEDFTLMIQTDYEQRLATAKDPTSVKPRSPQEIMDERFNKPDLSGWRRYWRHVADDAGPSRLDQKAGYVPRDGDVEGSHSSMEDFPDMAAEEARRQAERYQELCAYVRKKLKPDYAEMLIAIHMDGYSVNEYAARTGDSANNVSHRLKRAEKKLKEIFEKRPICPSPVASKWEDKQERPPGGGEKDAA